MNTKTLGHIGLFCAPFLFLDILFVGYQYTMDSRLMGFLDLVYAIGWLCSLVGLWRLNAAGRHWSGRAALALQIILVILAAIWALYQAIQPAANTLFYYMLDFTWPAANAFMLITGIVITAKGVLGGWQRWITLLAGLWLPISAVLITLFTRTPAVQGFVGVYSTVMWGLLALTIYRSGRNQAVAKAALQYA